MPTLATTTLTATADSAMNINLSWTAVANATSYAVNYSTSATMSGSTVINTSSGTSYTYNSALAGTTLYFTVTASAASYTSSTSAVKSAVPKTNPGAFPSAPIVSYSATGQPILTWTGPTTVGYSGSLTYTVQDSSNGNPYVSASTTATSPYTFSGLQAGVSYNLQVIAKNSQNLTSTSSVVSGTPYTTSSAPQSISAALSTTSATQAIITFKAPASNGSNTITSYTVTPSTAPTAVQSFSVPTPDGNGNMTVTVTGLSLNTTYTFSVKAVNAAGSGTGASTNSVKTNTTPGAPTSVIATVASSTSASVAFTAPASTGGFAITGYTVTPYIGVVAQTPVSGSSSPLAVTGLSANNSYTFKVQATTLAGTGTASSASNTVVLPIIVSAPSGASYAQPSGSTYANATIQYTALALSGATVAQQSAGVWTITANGLTDTLTNIKMIQCTDRNGLIVDAAAGTYGSRLSSAVAAARSVGSDGDTIFIGSGSFIESTTVTILKSVTIQGPLSGDPAIIGSTVTMYNIHVICHNVTINNITLDYSYQSTTATSGAYPLMVYYSTNQIPPGDSASSPPGIAYRINNFACNNVVFTNPFTKGTDPTGSLAASQRGVALNGVNNVTFNNCAFPKAFNFGLAMSSCTNVTVTNSTFNPCGWGSVGIFPSGSYVNLASYTTSNINLSDSNNVFNTMSPITVQPRGATSAVALPTVSLILMQPNSGTLGDSNYPFTCGTDGTTDVKLPSAFDYLYISDPTVEQKLAGYTYASRARYLSSHQYLESTTAVNGYGRQISTGNYLIEDRFNPVPLLNNIAVSVLEFQSESNLLSSLTDSQLSAATAGSTAVIISDDQQRSYIYNANVSQAVAKAAATASANAALLLAPSSPFTNLYVMSHTVSPTSPSSPVSVQTASSDPYTILVSALASPAVRQQDLYVSSSADRQALLTASELAPLPPTIVSVVPGNGSLTVTWTDNPGGSPTDHFNVTVNGNTNSSVTSPYQITGLTNGTNYTVNVDAVNTYGDASSNSSGTPVSVPGAPSEVSQVAGDRTIDVTWSAPTNTGGSNITSYTVYWHNIADANDNGSAVTSSSATTYQITGLTDGQQYEWSVSATNAVGEGSQSSFYSPITPVGVPSQPQSVSVSNNGVGSVSVSWNPPNSNNGASVTGYTVYVTNSSSNTTTHSSSASPATITGLDTHAAYQFAVSATNSAGESARSSSVSFSTSSVPGAPTGVSGTATGTAGEVNLSWTAPANNGSAITGYNIYNSSTLLLATNSTSTSATLTGLTNGTTYAFTVTAVNGNGAGSASTPSSDVIPYQQVTLTLSNLSQTYTGSALNPTVTASPTSSQGDAVDTTISVSGDNTNVGSCQVTASVSDPSKFHATDATGTLTITKAHASVTLSNLTQAWTGSALDVTTATSPTGLSVSTSYVGNHTDPGAYPVTATVTDPNYSGDASGTLVITADSTNAPAAIAAQNPTTSGGLAATLSVIQQALATSSDPVATAASLGVALVDSLAAASAARADYVSVIVAAMNTIAASSTGGLALLGAPTSAMVQAAANAIGDELLNTVYQNTPYLGALVMVAAINAIKTNSSDPNAATNADALTGGLLTATQVNNPSGTTFGFGDSASISTLLANTNCQTLPTYVILALADTTNTVAFGDPLSSFGNPATSAYYIPLQTGQSYNFTNERGQTVGPFTYDAASASLTNTNVSPPTVATLGSNVALGFSSYTVNVIGTVGFTNPSDVYLRNVAATGSRASATVSWALPNLGGISLASIRVVAVVNGSQQASQNVSPSSTTYTLSGLSNGDTVSFVVTMVDGNGILSTSVTSNTVTITINQIVPCFPKGTPIATPSGYKAIDTLAHGDLVLTSDGRQVPIRLFGKYLPETSERTAPFFIPKNTFGPSAPAADLTLSPDHAFLLRKGVWMLPRTAAKLSNKVRQIGVGYPIHYFNLECPNYLRDNLLVNGAAVESYGGKTLDFANPYTWSEKLRGYTRPGYELTEVKPEKQSKPAKK